MSDLGWRLITAAVLIPAVVLAITVLPTPLLALTLGAVMLAAALEWATLMGWRSRAGRWGYTLALVPLLYGAYRGSEFPFVAVSVFALALVWWGLAFGWVVRFQRGLEVQPVRTRFAQAASGCIVLLPPWLALVCLHRLETAGSGLVLFLFALIWAADSGAYIAGRYLGRSRLASRVSPGKSWAGVVGALVCVVVLAVAADQFFGLAPVHTVVFVLMCLGTVLVSILGDLVESLFKRLAGVKDSGTVLPGHGGVLDRIDSLTSAAPFFALGVLTMGTHG